MSEALFSDPHNRIPIKHSGTETESEIEPDATLRYEVEEPLSPSFEEPDELNWDDFERFFMRNFILSTEQKEELIHKGSLIFTVGSIAAVLAALYKLITRFLPLLARLLIVPITLLGSIILSEACIAPRLIIVFRNCFGSHILIGKDVPENDAECEVSSPKDPPIATLAARNDN